MCRGSDEVSLLYRPLQHQGSHQQLGELSLGNDTLCYVYLLLATETRAGGGQGRAFLCPGSGHRTRQKSFPTLAPTGDAEHPARPGLAQGSVTPPALHTGTGGGSPS